LLTGTLLPRHPAPPRSQLWRSHTANRGTAPYRLTLNSNGNLRLTDARGAALWASSTAGLGGAPYALRFTAEEQLCLRGGGGNCLWWLPSPSSGGPAAADCGGCRLQAARIEDGTPTVAAGPASPQHTLLTPIHPRPLHRRAVTQLSSTPTTWLSTAPGFPRQLGSDPATMAFLLTDDGELQMLVEGELSWSSNTAGQGYGPFRLQVRCNPCRRSARLPGLPQCPGLPGLPPDRRRPLPGSSAHHPPTPPLPRCRRSRPPATCS
jgi:hypothetical protein